MRGLSFKILAPRGVPLLQILECIQVENFCWYVDNSQNDMWDINMERLLFDHIAYDGSSFYKAISQEHFVCFLKLQAYFPNGEYDEIMSYDRFQKSECQFLLLIHDCCYIDIYIKDQAIIKDMYQHAVKCGWQNVRYLNDENDTRNRMRVI